MLLVRFVKIAAARVKPCTLQFDWKIRMVCKDHWKAFRKPCPVKASRNGSRKLEKQRKACEQGRVDSKGRITEIAVDTWHTESTWRWKGQSSHISNFWDVYLTGASLSTDPRWLVCIWMLGLGPEAPRGSSLCAQGIGNDVFSKCRIVLTLHRRGASSTDAWKSIELESFTSVSVSWGEEVEHFVFSLHINVVCVTLFQVLVKKPRCVLFSWCPSRCMRATKSPLMCREAPFERHRHKSLKIESFFSREKQKNGIPKKKKDKLSHKFKQTEIFKKSNHLTVGGRRGKKRSWFQLTKTDRCAVCCGKWSARFSYSYISLGAVATLFDHSYRDG